jgi:hypothetical protein
MTPQPATATDEKKACFGFDDEDVDGGEDRGDISQGSIF